MLCGGIVEGALKSQHTCAAFTFIIRLKNIACSFGHEKEVVHCTNYNSCKEFANPTHVHLQTHLLLIKIMGIPYLDFISIYGKKKYMGDQNKQLLYYQNLHF